ncbi:glycoside hydrolase family 76 protein [Alienimonas sp. DA493]|uniref:glycoside hydrolase family 76 protein n=1 Tax=Alienimonas sp. DA493 TaxID=3373605 RepID=UPI00375479FD
MIRQSDRPVFRVFVRPASGALCVLALVCGVAPAAVSLDDVTAAAGDAAHPAPPPGGWAAEAERLTRRVREAFWDEERGRYVSPVAAEGTVRTGDERGRYYGHTLWPLTDAFRMLAAAEAARPGEYRQDLEDAFAALERYYDPSRSAYNAWFFGPGNLDSYSDDNAWLIMGFCEATVATGDRRYADRAAEVMENYVHAEWRDDDGPLGMRWGFRPDGPPHQNQRAAISASTAAVAALKLADLGVRPEENVERAATYLEWVESTCVTPDGLTADGLKRDGDEWRLDGRCWSYNTGLTLIGTALLYDRTGRPELRARLKRTADAAIDRDGALYDEAITDPARRYPADTAFFIPHLIEGLAVAAETLDEPKYRAEAERTAAYLYRYVRDPADGLYFRNARLRRIDATRDALFREQWAGAFDPNRAAYRPAGDERVQSRRRWRDRGDRAERPLVKTLLPSAAVARMYWTLAATADDAPPPATD